MALPNGVTTGDYVSKSNRLVFRIMGTNDVVKLGCPKSYRSGRQNVIESKAWERVKGTEAARYVNPVLRAAEDGEWLIQPFVEDDQDESAYDHPEFYSAQELLEKYGIVGDFNDSNVFVTLDSRLVVIDYGYDRQEWQRNIRKKDTDECGDCLFCVMKERLDNGEFDG